MSEIVRRALLWWVAAIAARPALVVLLMCVIAAAMLGYTVRHLGIDTSTTDMISAEVPFRQNDIAFKRAFPRFTEPIVAVVEAPTAEQASLAAEALAQALRADAEHVTGVDYPEGEPFMDRQALLFLPPERLAGLVDRLAAAQPLLAVLAEDPSLRGLAEFVSLALEQAPDGGSLPEGLDRLLGAMAEVVSAQVQGEPRDLSWRRMFEDGAADAPARRLLMIQPRLDRGTLAPAEPAIQAVRAEARALGLNQAYGGELRLTGPAVLDQEELESVSSGALAASLLTTVAVSLLLVWGLRSLRLILATLATLAIGLIVTAGLAALTVGRLNLISVTFAVLFVGLGVDFGIHLVLRYREALDREAGHAQALREAITGVGGALSLSALCAALGFLAFVPTSYQGLAELGIISAIGMAVAWFMSLTLLPALLCLSPPPAKPQRMPTDPGLLPSIERHRRPILAAAVVLGLVSLPALPKIEFDFNPLNLKDPAAESVRTFRALAADSEPSPHVIEVLAPGLEEARALADRLEAVPTVDQAITLQSFVPDDQEEKLDLIDGLALYLGPALDASGAAAPLEPGARAEALTKLRHSLRQGLGGPLDPGRNPGATSLDRALEGFEEAFDASPAALAGLEQHLVRFLPILLDQLRVALQASSFGLADLPAGIRERWLNAEGQARIMVTPEARIRDNQDLRAFAAAVLAEAPRATGEPVIVSAAGDAVVAAFYEASVLALGLITLVLLVVFRRAGDVLMVLASLGLAVLLTAGNAVLLGLELNFANVIVLPLLLGLGVSGAIHVVMRWREQGAADIAGTSTPRAVLFSALTTIASFGSLAISDHRGLASMGLLLTGAILWSLMATLIVLPSLLAHRSNARRGSGR